MQERPCNPSLVVFDGFLFYHILAYTASKYSLQNQNILFLTEVYSFD